MFKLIKSIYVTSCLFYFIGGVALMFLFSYWWQWLYGITWILVLVLLLLMIFEFIMIYRGNGLIGERILPEKFSNSDLNTVSLLFQNKHPFTIKLAVIDELPVQFQKRDFIKKINIPANGKSNLNYEVRPVARGEYFFGNLNCYVSSTIGLIQRRYNFSKDQMVKVYPSFIQMKKYDFLAIDKRISHIGLRKIRRIGHSMEFEQIKDYVIGDDVRTVNWKATGKNAQLMVNQYQDEKMQPVFSIIDTSRVMKMPFNNLSLLDYAINSALAFSNIALKKKDKVGLFDFSNKPGKFLSAQAKKTHLNTILETLYNVETNFLDSDFGILQRIIKTKIPHRSLLMLYTNFEHISSLHRQLPYLRMIAKKHVLVVIFFENSELKSLINPKEKNLVNIADSIIARQFELDKKQMVQELEKRGIQTILTAPENLTVSTINKYLEIKARGLL